jgi:hypothetical protein
MRSRKAPLWVVVACALALGVFNAAACGTEPEPEQPVPTEEVSETSTDEVPEADVLGCPVCGAEDEEQYTQCMLRCQSNGGTNAGCKRTCCRETCGSTTCYIC